MSIETRKLNGPVLVLVAALVTMPTALAQPVQSTNGWEEDQELDRLMGTLVGPVWQPLWIDSDGRRRAPVSPLFLQQPRGAQEDFRPPPAPVIVPEPAPAPPPKAEPKPAPAPPPDPCAVPNPPKSCFP
jgi:hypothetical protein